MIPDSKKQDGFSGIFDGFLSLQSESYEFIIRTVAMHGWLWEAYSVLQRRPRPTPRELQEAWHSTFDQLYRHVSAAFLRSTRFVTLLPDDVFRMITDAFTGFSRMGGGGMFPPTPQGNTGNIFNPSVGQSAIRNVLDLAPSSVLGKLADEQLKAYLENLAQFFGSLGENEFLFPKTYFVCLQKLCTTYPRLSSVYRTYEAMFRGAWDKSFSRFIESASKLESPDFKVFFNTYLKVLAEQHDELLRSTDFIQTQSALAELSSEMVSCVRKMFEDSFDMFPVLPFVTETQFRALGENVHSYRRKMGSLERRITALEDRLNTIPSNGHGDQPEKMAAQKGMESRKEQC